MVESWVCIMQSAVIVLFAVVAVVFLVRESRVRGRVIAELSGLRVWAIMTAEYASGDASSSRLVLSKQQVLEAVDAAQDRILYPGQDPADLGRGPLAPPTERGFDV